MRNLIYNFPIIFFFSAYLLNAESSLSDKDNKLQNILLSENFNSDHKTSELATLLLSDDHVKLAKAMGPDGSDAIKVAYEGYKYGSKRIVIAYPLKRAVPAAKLSFDVCFDNDFQWVEGGKLHGLASKKIVSGGEPRKVDSWSARILFQENGKCATYLYDQSKNKKWGIGDGSRITVFQKQKWHHIELIVKLNDVDKSNGSSEIKIEGKQIVSSNNIIFREINTDQSLIQTFLFSTFHGGHSIKYAPVDENKNFKTVYAYYDNFKVEQISDKDDEIYDKEKK